MVRTKKATSQFYCCVIVYKLFIISDQVSNGIDLWVWIRMICKYFLSVLVSQCILPHICTRSIVIRRFRFECTCDFGLSIVKGYGTESCVCYHSRTRVRSNQEPLYLGFNGHVLWSPPICIEQNRVQVNVTICL